jgi:hypothetical protein
MSVATMRQMTWRVLATLAFCLAAASASALWCAVAQAESGETTPTPGGELCISSPPAAGSFSGQLTGMGLTLNADEAGGGTPFSGFVLTDSRGTGVGWYVTVTATRFENQTFPGKDIALDSLTMPRLAVESADASCTAPPGELHPDATVDTGGDGVVMAACTEHGQGMGTYIFTAAGGEPWTLAITADEYAGTYTSTVTTTVATLAL